MTTTTDAKQEQDAAHAVFESRYKHLELKCGEAGSYKLPSASCAWQDFWWGWQARGDHEAQQRVRDIFQGHYDFQKAIESPKACPDLGAVDGALWDRLYLAAERAIHFINRHPYGQPISGDIRRALQAIVAAKLTTTQAAPATPAPSPAMEEALKEAGEALACHDVQAACTAILSAKRLLPSLQPQAAHPNRAEVVERATEAVIAELKRQNLAEDKDVARTKYMVLVGVNEGITCPRRLAEAALSAMPTRDDGGLVEALAEALRECPRIHSSDPEVDQAVVRLSAVENGRKLLARHRSQPRPTFQSRVAAWMDACFGPAISADKVERNHRFLEEALELVQALGCSREDCLQLVEYVYGRPVGEPSQEVGGVMVTLAALCLASGLEMDGAAEIELARVWTKIDVIRAKQAAKPRGSALPVSPSYSGESEAGAV